MSYVLLRILGFIEFKDFLNEYHFDKTIANLSFLYFFIGIPLAFSRLADPFLYEVIKGSLFAKSNDKVKYYDESLLSFLNSALNVEFVYLILLGVRKFLKNDKEAAP